MRFARVHKVAAYVLAALGLVVLAAGGELAGVPTVLFTAGFVASWFAEGELLQRPGYVRAWNVVVVAVLVLEVLRALFADLSPLSAAVEFASVLQLSRLANRRTAKDYQQITVLAMLHLIAATVLGAGLSYALCFLGFVIAAPWAMTLGHLRREIEGNYLADARAGRQHVPIDVARILRSRRVVGPGLLIGSSLLSIPIFLLTSLLFVLFPRLGLGIFSVRGGQGTTVAGLGDRVDLSGHGTIRDDPTVVLRVEPPNLPAEPPPYRAFRLRGAAFDTYDGVAWQRSAAHQARGPVTREASWYRLRRWDDELSRGYRIVLDPITPPVVLLPPRTNALRVEPRIEAGLPRYPELTTDAAGEVRYTGADDAGIVYTVIVPPDADAPYEGDRSALEDDERARYTALPAVSPRLVALARELTEGQPTALEKARAVERYLQRFRYTLTLESGGAARPLEDFLFRTRAGHCEYFSSAMAVLLRAVSVPTRNVTGFLGGAYNRYGRFYAIKQGDAHSWVEVYDDDRGWITFDPTPPAREVPVARSRTLAELEAFVEAMRVRWRRYIVGFDLSTQSRLAMRFGQWFRVRSFRPGVTRERGVDRGAPPTASRRQLGGGWLFVAVGLVFAGGVVVLVRRRRREGGLGVRRAPPTIREAQALAAALDTAWSARGRTRPRSRSPLAHAEEQLRSGDPLGPLAERVARRYTAARFGDEPLRPGELAALKRELTKAPPLA